MIEQIIPLAAHVANGFGFFFAIGALGSFEKQTQKTLGLWFVTTFFVLGISVVTFLLQILRRFGHRGKIFVAGFSVLGSILLLEGINAIYTGYCIGPTLYPGGECMNKSRTYTAGSLFQLGGMLVLIFFCSFF
ncbi:hypothetical protein M0811_03782 [Anaeramoeba ignava]|uniref:Uncharacterized protein n=1 Tax=Anaeramoeba ignava TaxID=1746090 RepID=A0A9Q0LWK1_ANAIG|nr:hypothetical protein M0811_03782 [Anaeramoeba ignava]|eukprot:Anaeramoba_ignava/a481108_194.p1 GENE.a481108_194~~a481108_194.p1  ORF type:complete len:133 (+),score=28.55 a481108_194:19-417(+)